MDVRSVDLDVNSSLLASIKQTVIDVASTSGVLETIQSAAQATLQAGWSILLPTADERAKALCSLMPSSGRIFLGNSLLSSVKRKIHP